MEETNKSSKLFTKNYQYIKERAGTSFALFYN